MRLGVASAGRGRDALLTALADRYLERIRRFGPVVTASVPAATGEGRSPAEARRLEAARLTGVVEKWADPVRTGRGALVALDEKGEMLTSSALAESLRDLRDRGVGHVSFLVGGDEGLDPALTASADRVLALSRMTFTHEMARVVLLEQLYRALAILAGHPYHRA